MVGLIALVALILVAVEIAVLIGTLGRRGHAAAAGLGVLLAALMVWSLATERPGLGRLGWTSVGAEAGPTVQILVVALLVVASAAAVLQLVISRTPQAPRLARGAASMALLGAVGSITTAYTCFVE